jgi:hypothetical protein
MPIIGDATTWSITSDNYRGVIYDCNICIILVSEEVTMKLKADRASGKYEEEYGNVYREIGYLLLI